MTRIPKTWLGEPIEGSLERVLNNDKSQPTSPVTQQTPLAARANINPSDYLQIANKISRTNILIQKYQTLNGLKWQDTHFELQRNGLFMPRPYLMRQHLANVIDAVSGLDTLYDAAGNPISKDETNEIYQYLTKDNKGGVWTWLDAQFEKDPNDELVLVTNHKLFTKNNQDILEGTRIQLSPYVKEDCFVDLEFNSEGLPIKKSGSQKYEQGHNIYFWQPREGRVAWFVAYSDRAGLGCNWDPAFSYSGLGVLACAEGTEKKI